MEKRINVCDICGKEVRNVYKEHGWVNISKNGIKIIDTGDDLYKTDILTRSENFVIDFCSLKCFLIYLFSKNDKLYINTFPEFKEICELMNWNITEYTTDEIKEE